jgi:hypothetical protein
MPIQGSDGFVWTSKRAENFLNPDAERAECLRQKEKGQTHDELIREKI